MANIRAIVRSARPTHWVKNLVLFAALFFSGNLFVPELFEETIWAIVVFSIATSSCYFFNDVIDKTRDRQHPVKKRRPVASGAIPTHIAIFISVLLATISLFASSFFSFFFFLSVFAYITLQVFYTLILKTLPVIDILGIASGFILRIWAGAFVSNVHLSVWFILCTISAALFLAAGKRKAELAILESHTNNRRFLYVDSQLDAYLSMFATGSWFAWSLFTFFEPSPQVGVHLPFFSDLPLTLGGIGKWLMITIPVVIFGVMRYLWIVYGKTGEAETPERTLVRDKPLLISFLIWAFLVFVVIYAGPVS